MNCLLAQWKEFDCLYSTSSLRHGTGLTPSRILGRTIMTCKIIEIRGMVSIWQKGWRSDRVCWRQFSDSNIGGGLGFCNSVIENACYSKRDGMRDWGCSKSRIEYREVEGKSKTDKVYWRQFSDSNTRGGLRYIVQSTVTLPERNRQSTCQPATTVQFSLQFSHIRLVIAISFHQLVLLPPS